MKPIFELLENLNLVLAKLNPELGTAQPQLVYTYFSIYFSFPDISTFTPKWD